MKKLFLVAAFLAATIAHVFAGQVSLLGAGSPAIIATPVTVDAVGTNARTTTAGTSFSSSSIITVGSGANRALLVVVNLGSSGTTLPTNITATWNGVAMTQLYNTVGQNDFSSQQTTTVIFGLVNPASGAHALALSWTGSMVLLVDAISFNNVNQSGNQASFPNGVNFNSNGSASPSVTINAPANGYVVGIGSTFASINSINNTQLFLDNGGTITGAAANYAAAPSGGGAVTLSMSTNVAENATYSAVGVAPVPAPAYWVEDTFSRYANGATLQGAIPQDGPAWQTTGAILPTILNGQVVTGSTGVGYLYNNVQATPSSIGAVISFTGGTDMTQMPYAMAYATGATPLSLNDLLHDNLGPDGFNLTVRQAGGSFDTLLAQNWATPIPNDGSLHTVTMSVSGTTVTITKDSETYSVTDSRVTFVIGGTFFFEPFAGSDGLTCGVSQAWGMR